MARFAGDCELLLDLCIFLAFMAFFNAAETIILPLGKDPSLLLLFFYALFAFTISLFGGFRAKGVGLACPVVVPFLSFSVASFCSALSLISYNIYIVPRSVLWLTLFTFCSIPLLSTVNWQLERTATPP